MTKWKIRKGETSPKAGLPKIIAFHNGVKCTAIFPSHAEEQHGKNTLIGCSFGLQDSISVKWCPSLDADRVELRFDIVSCGVEYSYSLLNVQTERPVNIKIESEKHKRFSCMIESFDETFLFVTTHEGFSSLSLGKLMGPSLEKPAVNNYDLLISYKILR